MASVLQQEEMVKYRRYSAVFSRNTFNDVLRFDDYSKIDFLLNNYGHEKITTYSDYLLYIYNEICKYYRCEYVYKNEIINQLLIDVFAQPSPVAISEFRVGNSIVDLAMFNGESRAFEIKTELDTPKRIWSQICDYTRLFQKCYVVVPSQKLKEYEDLLGEAIGIITMSGEKGSCKLRVYREADEKKTICSDLVMAACRSTEYQRIIEAYYGALPHVSCFEMYEECKRLMASIPDADLQILFLKEIENRKNCSRWMKDIPIPMRQMFLSMNLNRKQAETLISKFNKSIS